MLPLLHRQRVWFHRHYTGFSGGHLKIAHYLGHVQSSWRWQPRLKLDASNAVPDLAIWKPFEKHRVVHWNPARGDLLFVAGEDWRFLKAQALSQSPPVINLIQGVRHADPALALYGYLSEPAIRICVSQQVADAINATGKVYGPVFVIPNGITLPARLPARLPWPAQPKVLLLGYKNPTLATELASLIGGLPCDVTNLSTQVSQSEFLLLLEQHQILLCCPAASEGFYLPALEAMARRTLVICPDVIGNRGFCLPGKTALMPEYQSRAMAQALSDALTLPVVQRQMIIDQAQAVSKRYSLAAERRAFLALLNQAHSHWADMLKSRP